MISNPVSMGPWSVRSPPTICCGCWRSGDWCNRNTCCAARAREPGARVFCFVPPPQANARFTGLAGQRWDRTEWETTKTGLLQALKSGKGTDYRDLLEEIPVRLSQFRSPMVYVAETIIAILLSLHQIREDASLAGLSERLRSLGLPGQMGLSALAGLTLGLSFVERTKRGLTGLPLSHIGRYQEIVSGLSAENQRRLSNFAGEVMKIVEA
jgi:hypothetical protein